MTGRRPFRGALLAVLVAVLASGCLRIRPELEVAADATVSGSLVIAAADSGALPGGAIPDLGSAAGGAGISVEQYREGSWVGVRIVLDHVAFADFNALFTDTGQLTGSLPPDLAAGMLPVIELALRADGGDVVLTGRFSIPDLGTGGTPPDVRVRVAFPGAVKDDNGRRDGRTVTWVVPNGEDTRLSARAALGGTPALAGGGDGDDRHRVLWLLAGGALLLGAVFLLLGRRSRPGPADAPLPDWQEPVPVVGSPVPPGPGLSPHEPSPWARPDPP